MFCKDSRQENFLTQFGVKWKYTNATTFEQLAPTWEQANMGRAQAKVDAVILEYAARTEAGSSAPAPILRKSSRGYEVLDGVQRLCAEKFLGTTMFTAYVVETDSDLMATQVRVFANHLLAGHPESADWNRKRIVQLLVIEGGMSIDEVARIGGWKAKDVEEEKLAMDFGFAIRCIGGPEQLPKGVLLTIAANAKMDDFKIASVPIAEFCSDLKRARFSNGESEGYIREFFGINRSNRKTIFEQLQRRLEKFRDESEVRARLAGRGPQRRQPDIKLRSAMKVVLTITEEFLRVGENIVYLDEFHLLWNQVDTNLKHLGRKVKT